MAELVLVFLGAYAAFSLDGYQQHKEEAKRRDQILAALEENARNNIADADRGQARQKERVAEFKRALAAGEMPPVRPINFSTDYNPNDMFALLQAGGFELLDVKTIFALREAESVIRGGLSRMAHDERLSDALIAPHLDEDISYFYDPATKQLRKRFARYPEELQAVADFFQAEKQANQTLLQQIRAEQKRRW